MTQQAPPAPAMTPEPSPTAAPTVIARKHPGRWIAVVLILVAAVEIIRWAATNPGFEWPVFRDYLFDGAVLRGVWNTILLTVLAEVISLSLGTLLAVMRMSHNRIISGAAFVYTWFFRGVPLPVLLIFIFFSASVLPSLGWGDYSIDMNDVFASPLLAAVIAFGLNDAAYTSEIVRSGLLSVPPGQREAAYAIGMSPARAMRRIVLPQALRIIIPPVGNAVISMLKLTSIAMVIGFSELMNTVRGIYSSEFNTIPMLVVATFWYLVLTTVLSIGQYFVERHFGKGHERR
ncbi:ABC transporter permease subunit [Microbacterium sp. zg.B48]|uniref:amino acid ABC transporter permease n=1 Tax=unclassified Microbacterium TaxID=2609290 RepID=UPI00214B9F44|nr:MULTISPECIES: ABC transporter permease subunit [unclassified Microbacterium]MCR2764257.1 ABC transporter permease subunit [Microbacterium sp. zg.B48]MCR2810524.1 ABC transporter permease subunit [Microbacterium sp. zg.B185]WIM19510.1 ABC transporter permease subunit [Microbacterium sp. zg-B185]